ncbi:MAG: exosortase-associated EpsI family protein [Phycisphaerales bacterium]|nr:exosortase-associated EpsI family protein [Phycisphaerales bacterium]
MRLSDGYRRIVVPGLTLAVLAALFLSGGLGQTAPAGADRYFDDVATSIEGVPYQIDSWVGVNLPLTEVAVRMLRPNKVLRRTYHDPLGGNKVSLSIIHCTDIRDMLGHHPPVCYPAHGWHLESRRAQAITLSGADQEAIFYDFSRLNSGSREAIRIISFFIAPGTDEVIGDMYAMERELKRRGLAALGAAQVQIVTPLAQSDAATDEMVAKILGAIQPVIDTIGKGVP